MVVHLDRLGEGKGGPARLCVSHEQRVSQASLRRQLGSVERLGCTVPKIWRQLTITLGASF